MQKWKGIYTAIVTPFDTTGAIDFVAYKKLLHIQKEAGISGVIPCGTTGESPTLSIEEKKKLILTALEELKGSSTVVVAGTGSNNTQETVELSKWASDQGVAGLLIVTPYYNKPSQRGLIEHFKAVADAVKCEIILYNVPSRTGVSLTADTIVELASHPKIRAIKEATGNLVFASEIITALKKQKRELSLLTGDDPTFLPFLSVGGSGVISVASNLCPKEMILIQSLHESGKWKEAALLHQRLSPLFSDLFVEANPVPVKYALSLKGLCGTRVRAPLAPLSPSSETKVKAAMDFAQLEGNR